MFCVKPVSGFGRVSDQSDCDVTRERLRDREANYLWFNSRTFGDYFNSIGKITAAYPAKQFPDIDITWSSVTAERPFRKVEFSGIPLADLEAWEDLEQTVLFLGNGVPGKKFRLQFSRKNDHVRVQFEAALFEEDTPLVRLLYFEALNYYRCGGNFEFEKTVLNRTELLVENKALLLSSRFTLGS